MNKNESGFSLIIVVVFMSIAALFVGYIMGSWLISFMTEEPEQQMADNNVEEVEKVEDIKSSELAADEQVERTEESSQVNTSDEERAETTIEQSTESKEEKTADQSQFEGDDLSGTFAVQIGAFNNIDSAEALKAEMEDLGFEAFITESKPHKIRVGTFATREEAEDVEAQLEEREYDGFIVLRD